MPLSLHKHCNTATSLIWIILEKNRNFGCPKFIKMWYCSQSAFHLPWPSQWLWWQRVAHRICGGAYWINLEFWSLTWLPFVRTSGGYSQVVVAKTNDTPSFLLPKLLLCSVHFHHHVLISPFLQFYFYLCRSGYDGHLTMANFASTSHSFRKESTSCGDEVHEPLYHDLISVT